MRQHDPAEGEKMMLKGFFTWILVVSTTLLIGGCTIGNWNICGPQTPRANCDREASQRLLHPTPLSDEWEKQGVSSEARRQDWIRCGGDERGWYYVPTKSTGKQYNAESALMHHNIQRCMLGKGYRFTGACDAGNEVTNKWPACGAP